MLSFIYYILINIIKNIFYYKKLCIYIFYLSYKNITLLHYFVMKWQFQININTYMF